MASDAVHFFVSMDHLYIPLKEVSIHVLCLFLIGLFVSLVLSHMRFFIYIYFGGYTFVWFIIDKYVLPYLGEQWVPFSFCWWFVWFGPFCRISFALILLWALQKCSYLWQLTCRVLHEFCIYRRLLLLFSFIHLSSKQFIIFSTETLHLLYDLIYVSCAAASNNHLIILKKRQTCILCQILF